MARKPLTEAQQDLAARYLPLARSIARPYKARWPRLKEDFESAAGMALVEAAEAFDPSRNVRFATFARHRIRGALRDVLRKTVPMGFYRYPGRIPVVGPMPANLPERHARVIGIQEEPPIDEAIEAVEAVESWLRKLPARHAAACRQIYLHGKSQLEAGRILGITQSRLSYMHAEAMSILDGSWEAAVLSEDIAS